MFAAPSSVSAPEHWTVTCPVPMFLIAKVLPSVAVASGNVIVTEFALFTSTT